MSLIFPFTAIVGQERMKRALVLNAIDPRIGGVLIRGERGTAKSTAARALAALLPEVKVIDDCRFSCNPDTPDTWCTECQERAANSSEMAFHVRATPFINLPVSATEDRVVGTLDIEKAIQQGERHFEPGVLAAANRGLLYIDEVNLLDDHVVDVLLDAAAMGVNNVEREGISFSHPARFILVGTMNPEEGDLRPQLLDRFALSVEIYGIRDARERVMIMERNLAYEMDSEKFKEQWASSEKDLSQQIGKARDLLEKVTYTSGDLLSIASLTASLNVDGHRPDLVILKTARAQAAFDGRTRISDRDIALASELALPHRLRRGPFQQDEITIEELQERIEQLRGKTESSEPSESTSDVSEEDPTLEKKKVNEHEDEVLDSPNTQPDSIEPGLQDLFNDQNAQWWEEGKRPKIGQAFSPRRLDTPLDKLVRRHGGRRSRTHTDRKRGRYIQARPSSGKVRDLAFDATIRAAAPFQRKRQGQRPDVAFDVRSGDYMEKVRVQRSANFVLFLVDASWSMAVTERMEATKGAIFSLLTDAYQRRDRVGLIIFQKDRSTLVLPPTNSVDLARRALENIPIGGKTPLSSGLLMAYEILKREQRLHPEIEPLLVVLTDGAGNVSMGHMPPQEEAYYIASLIADDNIHSIVVNMEHAAFDQGLAQALAEGLEAPCYNLGEIRADNLYDAVRHEMSQSQVSMNV